MGAHTSRTSRLFTVVVYIVMLFTLFVCLTPFLYMFALSFSSPKAIINISTGGSPGQTLEDRLMPVPELKPEMASYTPGALTFGMYSRTHQQFIYDVTQPLTFKDMKHFADTFAEHDTKPEIEAYCASMLNNIKIIETAFEVNFWAGLIALLGAGITAFYMTRMFSMTFLGKARWREDVHPHESPWIMMGPVAILAVLSFGAGWYLSIGEKFVNWLEPITGTPEPHSDTPYLIPVASLTLVAIGAAIAWVMYSRNPVPEVAPRGNLLTRAAREELYGNAVNEAVFMRPGQYLTRFLVWFDNRVVDGAVNGTAATIGGLSGRVRRLQTGFTRSYALSMLGGAALVAVALVLVRL